jgi:hypothetical protein
MSRRRKSKAIYESGSAPLLPWPAFVRRQLVHLAYGTTLIVLSLGVGTIGFHLFAGQEPIDAFLNASMLLGGMGPVGDIKGFAGKAFAALFALYAGLVFLISAAVLLAPSLHRLLHSLHMADQSSAEDES